MNKFNVGIIIATALTILSVINYSIWEKEVHLAAGESVYLELAPADPRSIMQGDYMTIRFKISGQIRNALLGEFIVPEGENITGELDLRRRSDIKPQEGIVIVSLDENKRAEFSSLGNGMQRISDQQRKLKFKVRDDRVKFATNAFFFEEGDAQLFDKAKYGELRVNKSGEVMLTALLDENLVTLGEGKY